MLEIKEAIKVGKYTLENPEKIMRSLHGSMNDKGEFVGGVLKNGAFDDDELLAEYDRIGGLITRSGDKVATGSFYNFAERRRQDKPSVMLEFRINGELVHTPEKDMSPEEEAARAAAKKKRAAKKATKK